jgi:hypothetical protein
VIYFNCMMIHGLTNIKNISDFLIWIPVSPQGINITGRDHDGVFWVVMPCSLVMNYV